MPLFSKYVLVWDILVVLCVLLLDFLVIMSVIDLGHLDSGVYIPA